MSLVSIIIPCYNAASYIVATMESVIAQSYTNWECIVVDDHSIDNSWEILYQYQNRYPHKIFLYKNVRKGACAARNTGLEQAKGKYIQFLDADDLLSSNKLAAQLAMLAKHPEAVVACNWQTFNENNTSYQQACASAIKRELSPTDWLKTRETMLPHAWLTPASIIKRTGWWNEALTINQDGEYFYRIVSNCKTVLFCDETIVYYRIGNPNSLSAGKRNSSYFSSQINGIQSYESCLLKLTDKDDAKTAIGNAYKHLLFLSYLENKIAYVLARSHWAIPFATIKYPTYGKTEALLLKLLGWKLFKKIALPLKTNISKKLHQLTA